MSYTGSVPDTRRAPDWRESAACAGAGDDMFPGSNEDDIEDAKSYCRRCPVADHCLQWALDTGIEFGVWGGLSEAERRVRLRRRGPARPIIIDDYTGTTPTRTPCRPLEDVWKDGIEPDGEHIRWVGPKIIHRPRPEPGITANRLSFYLDRGRWPEGDCKRMCDVDRCVKPSHLTDRRERAEENELAVAV